MGLEQTFEGIAHSLERIASALEENTKINAWYKTHLCKCDGSCAPDAPPPEELDALGTEAESATTDASVGTTSPIVAEPQIPLAPQTEHEPAPPVEVVEAAKRVRLHRIATTALGKDLTFDDLKQELAARGYIFKKGTKATTLQKAWDRFKFQPIYGDPGFHVVTIEKADSAPASEPAPAPVEEKAADEPFDPLSVGGIILPTESKALMTVEECREVITKEFVRNRDEQCIIDALVACGVREFRELKQGQYEAFINEFRKQKEARDAGK